MKKKALVSLSDKTGILDFAKRMSQDFDFISTGGTRQHLEQGGIKCTSVAQITGAEEILDGRVKTLHPKIHAAILSRRSVKDKATLNRLKIENIDMVVVNFYPFENNLKKNLNDPEILEFIDKGLCFICDPDRLYYYSTMLGLFKFLFKLFSNTSISFLLL